MRKCKFVTVLFIVLLLFTISPITHAQTGTAGQAGEFLRYGVGAKALAMGRTFTSLANDVSAVYWNPAGIGQLNQTQVAIMHSQLFLDTRYQFLGLARPIFSNDNSSFQYSLGFGYIGLGTDDFEGRDSNNLVTNTFNSREWAILIPNAFGVVKRWGVLNLGFKPILFSQSIGNVSDTGWGVDFGFVYQPLSPGRYTILGLVPLKYLMPWRIGMNFRYLSDLTLVQERQDYPNSINFGVSNGAVEDLLALLPGSFFSNKPLKITLSYELEKVFSNGRSAEHHIGSEVRYRFGRSIIAALRTGYQFGREDVESRFTWGLGFSTDADWLAQTGVITGLGIDLGRTSHPELDAAYHLYFTAKLGKWKNNIKNYRGGEKIPYPKLLRLLSEYPFDDRVVEELQAIDIVYKDTVAADLSYIAETVQHDELLTERYDNFMGGLRKIDKKVAKAWKNLSCESNRAQFAAFRRDYEERKKELSKKINFASLTSYLKVLLLLGETDSVKAIVNGTHREIRHAGFARQEHQDDKNYLLAFATRAPMYCDPLARTYLDRNNPNHLLLQLSKSVYNLEHNQDPSNLSRLLETYRDDVFTSRSGRYEPLPLLCDGILADDIMFIAAYHQARSLTDAKAVRDLFLPIVLELPYSDLGRAISAKLTELYAVREDYTNTIAVFDSLWQRYKTLYFKNQSISVESLVPEIYEKLTFK